MATIITREIGATAKGSPLTNAELDQNFINLNTNNVELTDIGTAPNEVPLNQFLGELAYMDAQNIPSVGIARADIAVVNAATANVTNLLQVTEISNVVPTLNLDFAKVKQLDPRITFTRASTATYYDGKTLAKAEENLFTFSQEFNNAAWVKTNAIINENTGDTTAPDGTATAEKLTVTGGSNAHAISQSLLMAISTYTVSVFAKKGTQLYFKLGRNTGTAIPTPGTWWWDLDAGTFNGTLGAGWTNQSITSVGNGWYRCVVSVTTTASGTDGFSVALTDNTGNNIFSADANTFYTWGAQLEQRASATVYTPTTAQTVINYIPVLQTAALGVPRFEHNPVTGESLGLEIEEQRTNLVTYSEQFDNAAWTKTNATITANTIVAPDGTLTGDKLVEDTANASHFVRQNAVGVVGTAYTSTVFLKAAERTAAVFVYFDGSLFCGVSVNLSSGVLSAPPVDLGLTDVSSSAVIHPFGNGWYRVSIARTQTASTTVQTRVLLQSGSNGIYTGNGTSGIFIWGAQLEAGAFPTSYIPTVASQVTRAADVAVMTGTNFSSWYNQSEGTIYTDFQSFGQASTFPTIWQTDDGTAQNALTGYVFTNILGAAQRTFNVSQGDLNTTGIVINWTNPTKMAYAYATNNSALSGNGSAFTGLAVDNTVTIPVVNTLRLGGKASGVQPINGYIRKIAYHPQRLSNAELAEMTA